MKQQIADPTFGLDRKLQAVLQILSTVEPNFAKFDEAAQMYEVSFRTGIFYEEGLDPQVWIAMFPRLIPEGECVIQGIGLDIQGQFKISQWGLLENLGPRESPDPNRREGDLLLFKKVQQAVDHVIQTFKTDYEGLAFDVPRQTRLSLL